jgi:hypothetical protein
MLMTQEERKLMLAKQDLEILRKLRKETKDDVEFIRLGRLVSLKELEIKRLLGE